MRQMTGILENKRGVADAGTAPSGQTAQAAQRLTQLRGELADVERELASVNESLRVAYEANDDSGVPALRARRDTLLARRSALAEDAAILHASVDRVRERASLESIERDYADLAERMAVLGPRMLEAVEAAAAVWADYEPLWREQRALGQRWQTHATRYASRPKGINMLEVLGVSPQFLGELQHVAGAHMALRRHQLRRAAEESSRRRAG